jgi:hypothetical protein
MQRALLSGVLAASATTLALAASSPSPYHIAVISGQGAMNSVNGSVAQGPVVEVEDQNNQPVKGAYVTFRSPSSGASLSFANGSTQFSTTTGDSGQAAAKGLKTDSTTGSYVIQVKANYKGQSIGPVEISEVNLSGRVAGLPQNSLSGGASPAGTPLGAGVEGVATAPEFQLNGTVVPDNANLMSGSEVASLDKPVTIDLKDGCDYLLAPNSAVKVEDHKLILESGKVRARHIGTCKVGAGSYLVSGNTPGADGLISYSGGNLQVASLNGTFEVAGNNGAIAGSVASGGDSSFGGAGGQAGQSGASAGGPSGATASTGASAKKALWIYAGSLAVALGGLGLAVDAILQPGTPTSP